MVNLRLRRAGLPVAMTALAAIVGTVLSSGSAAAATPSDTSGAAAAAVKSGDLFAPKSASKTRGSVSALSTDPTNFGDITGDGKADLAAIDASGKLWIYPGKAISHDPSTAYPKNLFNARFQAGSSGWNNFTAVVRYGDFNADGKQDILTRDKQGNLSIYPGTGTTPQIIANKGIAAGTGWSGFASITGAGDLNSDGLDDILGQKTDGTLWLYTGTGKVTKPFSSRGTQIGTGWKGDLLTAAGDWSGDGRPEFWFRNTKGYISLYQSKSGLMPIGKGEVIVDDAELGKYFKGIVGAGNLINDSQYLPYPDSLWQLKDGSMYIVAPDTDMIGDDVELATSGWQGYKLF
ncbi:FG-GAP repeat domain-containing protein [Actinoplanes siamensis]|uniref:VCBS repeat protein n=1 Tax=Actinoplanes siamensis TaxID=1223317 RepID=A0A919NEZ7_9ACTN|nr:VCBS repeat-containing protein [Actinoplanes siamensis]GIF09602.1 hypothetical protein Asi03nite_71400 [Actinoplanes siamensis]